MQLKKIEIYSKIDCPACKAVKDYLDLTNRKYEEKVLGKDFTREELLADFPNVAYFPVIFIGGEFVSYEDFWNYTSFLEF